MSQLTKLSLMISEILKFWLSQGLGFWYQDYGAGFCYQDQGVGFIHLDRGVGFWYQDHGVCRKPTPWSCYVKPTRFILT